MWQDINTNGYWNGELWNRRKDGEVYPEWITISAIFDDNGVVTNYVGISSDISLLKQHEKQLEHIAHYDALTGIPNRVLLFDRIQQALSQTRREQKLLAICYLDLDGFKPINDTLGHDAGDSVLIEISQRITHSLRGGDTLARIGGDEFAILLLGIENEYECQVSLDRLLNVIAKPIMLDGQLHSVTASIGVTLYPNDDDSPDTLLRHADQAMYLAKQSGKNRYHLFDSEQEMQLKTRNELRARIEQGLKDKEFELYYQPQVALISYKVIGVEALMRWRHPETGILSPEQFLPHIENSYLEDVFGEWVIDTALAQMDEWNKVALNLTIGINVSAPFLQTKGFVSMLRQKLLRYPTDFARQLQIEILETAALADISAVTQLIEECEDLGVSFALDDFGTGYSSLSYLRRLPADTLKIDLSFVRDMLVDKEDRAIVKGVIALAHTFNRSTVAEGVESQEHFDMLRDMGCDIAQGYGIAKPMPADQIVFWCREYAKNVHGEHDHKLNINIVPTDIRWDSKFEIGHERIDSEHKIFLELIMEVGKEVNSNGNYQRIQRLLYEVRKYAEFHFVSEENIMEEINYPALESHRSLHKRLLASLADSAFENNRQQESYIPLLNFLIEWFIMHTATEDKKVSLFIEAEQSIKGQP